MTLHIFQTDIFDRRLVCVRQSLFTLFGAPSNTSHSDVYESFCPLWLLHLDFDLRRNTYFILQTNFYVLMNVYGNVYYTTTLTLSAYQSFLPLRPKCIPQIFFFFF